MTDTSQLEDRDALYYPYIHFRDEDWLRGALLFFPHVVRMSPPGYSLKDTAFVRSLGETIGRRDEPLVGNYSLDSGMAYGAGIRLADRLAKDVTDPVFIRAYDHDAASATPGGAHGFQIHRAKFAGPLFAVLEPRGLIWETSRHRGEEWLAVHPKLGEVIMSSLAAGVAKERGCDVLTDSEADHVIASTRDEDTIYATLRSPAMADEAVARPRTLRVAQLVVAHRFDLSGLTAADYAAISKDRDALFDIKQVLADHVAKIPPAGSDQVRERYAKEAADAIVTAWEAKRRTFGHFMRRVVGSGADDEAKSAVQDMLGNLITSTTPTGVAAAGAAAAGGLGGALTALLAVGSGLVVGVAYHGVKTWHTMGVEEAHAPTRFLSQVAKHTGTLCAASRPSPA